MKKRKQDRSSSSSSRSKSESRSSSGSGNKESSRSVSRSRSRSRSKENNKISKSDQKKIFDNLHKSNKLIADKVKDAFGWTNEDNPFGDKNLAKPFIWKKKIKAKEKEGKVNELVKETQDLLKKEGFLQEIEKVRQRRAEREIEKLNLDEERNRLGKEKEEENFQAWLDKEELFHQNQERDRSTIRIEQGRIKPVDKFVKIWKMYKGEMAYQFQLENEMRYPFEFMTRLSLDEKKEMFREAKIQQEIETNDIVFWESILEILQTVIEKRENENARKEGKKNLRNGIDEAYEDDVNAFVLAKSTFELASLEKEIQETLENHDFAIDHEYWSHLLKKVKFEKAKTTLVDYYYNFKLTRKKNQPQIDIPENLDHLPEPGVHSPTLIPFPADHLAEKAVTEFEIQNELEVGRRKIFEQLVVEFLQRKNENKKKRQQKIENQTVKDSEENRIYSNKQIIQDGYYHNNMQKDILNFMEKKKGALKGSEENKIAEQIKEFEKSSFKNPDEVKFDDLMPMRETYEWMDKYKPRKPQYFNRVKMGYDWNKYNQTHYDHENPPPKVVQGYKFNIFYPDLIDKTRSPEYQLENLSDTTEFIIIKFKSGPPYEDLGFKIVNREWDFSDKKGFKSVFSRGILHLYFNFKRYRYRK